MYKSYLDVISLIERVHRHFLEVVKLELDGLGIRAINNVQGLILVNIGDAEMTIGELTSRGCYLGSNVSYNIKKMVENGHLSQKRPLHDRRLTSVRITDKGTKLRDRLQNMHQHHAEMLERTDITDNDLQAATVNAAPARALLGPHSGHKSGSRLIQAFAARVLGYGRTGGGSWGTHARLPGTVRPRPYACGGGFLAFNRANVLCTEASVSFAFCRSRACWEVSAP